MSRKKLPMYFDKKGKRWNKFYRGKLYRFPTKKYPTIESAWEAWLTKKAQVDLEHQATKPHKEEYNKAIQARRNLAHYCRGSGDFEQAKVFESEAEALLSKFNRSPAPPPLTPEEQDPISAIITAATAEINQGYGSDLVEEYDEQQFEKVIKKDNEYRRGEIQNAKRELNLIWHERLKQYDKPHHTDTTIHGTLETFLKTKKQKMEARELSVDRYAKLRKRLGEFRDWMGGNRAIDQITSKTLVDYHSYLMERVASEKLTSTTANNYMVDLKQFVRWAWEMDLCDLPRKLNSKDLAFRIAIPPITTYTIQEIQTLFANASDITKTYIALALNCGMTQVDISDLLKSEVDLKEGYITRKRSKTRNQKSVPVVKYKLWQITIQQLNKYQSPDPEIFLLNQKGEKLLREWIDEKGRHRKCDAIRSAFNRVATKTEIEPSFKRLRKTGATLLDSHRIYRSITHIYLGHSPRSIQERHYTAPPQDLLDEAMGWLHDQLFTPSTKPEQ